MKRRLIRSLCLAVLGAGLMAGPAAAERTYSYSESDLPGHVASFRLAGSNGYTIFVGAASGAYSGRKDGGGELGVGVFRDDRKGASAYRVPAVVSDAYIKADLGPHGRIDLAWRPSGREKTIPIRCSGGDTFTYEPGTFEGVVEFRGESGYTEARATRVRLDPFMDSVCASGRGRGESSGPSETGARLRGSSFAHGRRLSFQFNKNHPRGRVLFEADIRERRSGVSIYRSLEGWLPPASFRYDPDLRSARLSPPAPSAGSATLTRAPNSVPPLWGGDLALEFIGRTVSLAGPGVNVNLTHACFQLFDKPEAHSC